MILTKKAKLISNIGLALVFINFITMLCLGFKNGAVAFSSGSEDEKGYFTIAHGKRFDFTEIDFLISYWQGAVTFGSFFLFFLVIIPTLYATGDIKSGE